MSDQNQRFALEAARLAIYKAITPGMGLSYEEGNQALEAIRRALSEPAPYSLLTDLDNLEGARLFGELFGCRVYTSAAALSADQMALVGEGRRNVSLVVNLSVAG